MSIAKLVNEECQSVPGEHHSRIKVSVNPEPSMFDKKVCIFMQGLIPNTCYTLHSSTEAGNDLFQCFAKYISSCKGEINLSEHVSHGGHYHGVESMGLFWAMESFSDTKMPKRLIRRDASSPLVFSISIHDGWFDSIKHLHEQASEKKLITFRVTRLFMAPGVRKVPVCADGLQGTLFIPPGKGPFPGVINMFGGMPGTMEYKPALLASHGFAALGLSYHGVEGLPNTWLHLEMEYFEKAVDYLLAHESVKNDVGVGVIGVCKGGQIALAMADCLMGIKCVVAINCAVLAAHNSHSYKDKFWLNTEIENVRHLIKFTKQGTVVTRFTFPFYQLHDPEFRLRLFDFHKRRSISYMYIAALDDDDLPSEYYANITEKLLKSENHPNFAILRYPGAGHLLEAPYIPLCCEGYFRDFNAFLRYGGKPVPHCRAQEDSWTKQIEFLHANLKSTLHDHSKL